jgi:hypothetical protein
MLLDCGGVPLNGQVQFNCELSIFGYQDENLNLNSQPNT